mmetsp:Transcript_60424/g.72642  ORF Transcript_60424/g.72642 Transcript_60424/m.72642 type:complete len:88 (+) Transcript_60424:84-347(+)
MTTTTTTRIGAKNEIKLFFERFVIVEQYLYKELLHNLRDLRLTKPTAKFYYPFFLSTVFYILPFRLHPESSNYPAPVQSPPDLIEPQ